SMQDHLVGAPYDSPSPPWPYKQPVLRQGHLKVRRDAFRSSISVGARGLNVVDDCDRRLKDARPIRLRRRFPGHSRSSTPAILGWPRWTRKSSVWSVSNDKCPGHQMTAVFSIGAGRHELASVTTISSRRE